MAKKVKDYYDVPALEYFDKYFEILSNLKDDKDKYIQKSVANNLNDLYKEDKDKFNFIINTWKTDKNISKECEWVIKHGSRTADKKWKLKQYIQKYVKIYAFKGK